MSHYAEISRQLPTWDIAVSVCQAPVFINRPWMFDTT